MYGHLGVLLAIISFGGSISLNKLGFNHPGHESHIRYERPNVGLLHLWFILQNEVALTIVDKMLNTFLAGFHGVRHAGGPGDREASGCLRTDARTSQSARGPDANGHVMLIRMGFEGLLDITNKHNDAQTPQSVRKSRPPR